MTLDQLLATLPEDAVVPSAIVRKYLADLHEAHEREIDALMNAFQLVNAERDGGAVLQ